MTDLFFELETVALVLILKLVVLYFIRFGGPLCSFGRHPGGFEFAETLPRRPASLPLHKTKTVSRTSEASSAVADPGFESSEISGPLGGGEHRDGSVSEAAF